jgi:hypothetical protein
MSRSQRVDDMEKMTLEEFFILARRVGDALAVLNESRAMMGGAPQVERLAFTTPPHMKAGDAFVMEVEKFPAGRDAQMRPLVANKPIDWSPEELAKREKLRLEREAAILAAMPDDVRALK